MLTVFRLLTIKDKQVVFVYYLIFYRHDRILLNRASLAAAVSCA